MIIFLIIATTFFTLWFFRYKLFLTNTFSNPYIKDRKKSLIPFLKWRFTKRPQVNFEEKVKSIPWIKTDTHKIHEPSNNSQVTWIGHSTLLIQVNGINILTDPIFSLTASPINFYGPKRYTNPSLQIDELPEIHYVLITHNHYDHLDKYTVKTISNSAKWIVPARLSKWFKKLNVTNVIEINWWQSYQNKNLSITATPSQHWSKRGIIDDFCTHWCSYAIEISGFKCWYAGDTGYNTHQFKEIGKRYGPFDFAAIPIGGYEPRWFMHLYHVNPDESVLIHRDIRSKLTLGIHWGAFVLTDESIDEPVVFLQKALKKQGINPSEFIVCAIGETLAIPYYEKKS